MQHRWDPNKLVNIAILMITSNMLFLNEKLILGHWCLSRALAWHLWLLCFSVEDMKLSRIIKTNLRKNRATQSRLSRSPRITSISTKLSPMISIMQSWQQINDGELKYTILWVTHYSILLKTRSLGKPLTKPQYILQNTNHSNYPKIFQTQ